MALLKEKLGKRIKELRKEKGLTQENLAELIGIEPPNISKLEKGNHFPQPENIEKIATALNVSVKSLFDFDHFDDKDLIVSYIKNYIDQAGVKEIEFLYKTIINLNQFSKR